MILRSQRKVMRLWSMIAIILSLLANSGGMVNAFQTRSTFSRIGTATTTTTFRTSSSTQLNTWNNNGIEGPDRIKACIPYMLPLLDGDPFGKYIYQRIPPLNTIDELFIAPLVSILQSFPLLSLLLFIILSIGTRNAPDMSRSVRFNAQQAVLIDIGLIIPTLFSEGLADVNVPRAYAEIGCNFTYYTYMSAIIYCVTMNLRGRKPDQLPFLSNYAELMTGPF